MFITVFSSPVLEKENILIKPLEVFTHSSLKPEGNEGWAFPPMRSLRSGSHVPEEQRCLGDAKSHPTRLRASSDGSRQQN